MSMKKVASTVKVRETNPYKTANTVNKEGFTAWKLSDEEAVRQLMFTGTMGASFYATQKEQIEQSVDFLRDVIEKNPEMVAKNIVAGRNEGYIRTAPVLALTILSQKSPRIFRDIFNQVVQTGNDMEDFITFCKAIGRGYGSSVKKAMIGWLGEKLSSYYAIKYSRQISDAVRIARPKSTDPIYDYLMKNAKGQDNFLAYGSRPNSKVKMDKTIDQYEEALVKYPQLKAFEDAKVAIDAKEWDKAIKLITDARLDPMSLIGLNPAKELWKSLGDQMGTMMYLKYLNKLIREGAMSLVTLKKKLTVENLKKAKVFPFRVYIAYRNIELDGDSDKAQKVRDHLADVLDSYVESFDWGKWNQKFVIAPDVSGSMTSVIGQRIQNGRYTGGTKPAMIAGMFSGILYKGIEDCRVLPWGTDVNVGIVRPKKDTVISHINAIENASGGGTNMERPVEYMIDHKIMSDVSIFITDSMEWGTGWLAAWQRYRKIAPKAKAVLIRVDPNNTRPFSDEDAQKHGIYRVFGWNDNVLSWIENVVLG